MVMYILDIDECNLTIHNCDINAVCTDSVGSFECECNHGYSGNGTHCGKDVIYT